MEATGFAAKLADADLVVTGEGRIDGQTAFGKTALGVARRARGAGVPCIAVGGGVEPDGVAALADVGAVAVPVVERPQSVEEAMAAGAGAPRDAAGSAWRASVGLADDAGEPVRSDDRAPVPASGREATREAPRRREAPDPAQDLGPIAWSAAARASCRSCWPSSRPLYGTPRLGTPPRPDPASWS